VLLDEIRYLTNAYQKLIMNSFSDNLPPLTEAVKAIQLTYCHNNPNNYDKVKHNSIIAADSNFNVQAGKFPTHAAFLNGCIKIAAKT
jgi:hypothetical protein